MINANQVKKGTYFKSKNGSLYSVGLSRYDDKLELSAVDFVHCVNRSPQGLADYLNSHNFSRIAIEIESRVSGDYSYGNMLVRGKVAGVDFTAMISRVGEYEYTLSGCYFTFGADGKQGNVYPIKGNDAVLIIKYALYPGDYYKHVGSDVVNGMVYNKIQEEYGHES